MRIPKRILERRRSVRIDESLPFKIGHEGYEVEVRTLNISSHGAMCLIDKDIPLMTQLKVALTVPALTPSGHKEHTIHVKGVVVRKEEDSASEKYCIAVFFSDISKKDLRILQDFIDYRSKP